MDINNGIYSSIDNSFDDGSKGRINIVKEFVDLFTKDFDEFYENFKNNRTFYDIEKKCFYSYKNIGEKDSIKIVDPLCIKSVTEKYLDLAKAFNGGRNLPDDYKEMELKKLVNTFLTHLFLCYESYFTDNNYKKAEKNVFEKIKRLLGDEEQLQGCIDGIANFYISSKSLIPNDVYFDEKMINIFEQKKLRRLEFFANMLRQEAIPLDFFKIAGKRGFINKEDCAFILMQQPEISRNYLEEVMVGGNLFSNREEMMEYFRENNIDFFLKKANSEELANAVVNNQLDNSKRTQAVRKIRTEEIADFSPDLAESFFSVQDIPDCNYINTDKEGNRFIEKSVVLSFNRETFMRILTSREIKYRINISSDDIIDLYEKLNFNDLVKLNKIGLVKSEDIIKIIKFYNISDNQPQMRKDLANYYDLNRLVKIIEDKRCNPKFVENYNLFLTKLTPEEREKYLSKLKEDLNNDKKLYIKLRKQNFNFGKIEGLDFSDKEIENLYLDEDVNDQDVLDLYSEGYIPLSIIGNIFLPEQIKQNIQVGNLSVSACILLKDRENLLKNNFNKKIVDYSDLIACYLLEDGLTTEEIRNIIGDNALPENGLGVLLPDTVSSNKVRDLFLDLLISQDELKELVGRGIITEKQYDEFSEELASNKRFDELFPKTGSVYLTNKTVGNGNGVPYYGKSIVGLGTPTVKNDPALKEKLLKNLGFDFDRIQVFKGRKNSLNGYNIYPSKDWGVVIFMKPDKPGNATYVMSMQQGMFEKKNEGSNIITSNETKQSLRCTENIHVRNECKGWGKNIVDSIRRLSTRMKERYKEPAYKGKIDGIIKEIEDDYDRSLIY